MLETVKGHEHEALIKTALFTGMRSGELCGLTWDCVDFDKGLIYVKKQLCPPRGIEKNFRFDTLKNGKPRTLAPAPFVMETLREHKKRQEQQKKAAGDLWMIWGSLIWCSPIPMGSTIPSPTSTNSSRTF